MSGIQYFPDPQGIDLRAEIHDMLFGSAMDPGVGRPVLIRRLLDKHCICWNGVTGSPNPRCGYCQGEGYQFREQQCVMYIARNYGSVLSGATPIPQQNAVANIGFTDSSRAVAYCEYDVFPDYERYTQPSHPAMDKLYELKVTPSGELAHPVVRTRKWKLRSVTPHHGDYGRVEYLELGLDGESV
jgi:hypothetical protein